MCVSVFALTRNDQALIGPECPAFALFACVVVSRACIEMIRQAYVLGSMVEHSCWSFGGGCGLGIPVLAEGGVGIRPSRSPVPAVVSVRACVERREGRDP